MHKLWNFLSRHFEFVAVLVSLAAIFLGVEVHAYGSNLIFAGSLFVVLVALVIFELVLKKHHDRWQIRKLHSEFIDGLMEGAATSILGVTRAQHMRACLMVPNKDYLRITNQYGFSLENDLDLEISLPMNTGCAGRAWMKGQPVVADLEQTVPEGGPDWNLPPQEAMKVRPTLKSILSVPVKAGMPYRTMAVLNVDSDDRMSDTRFVDKEIQHIAYCFVKVLSSLLDETD